MKRTKWNLTRHGQRLCALLAVVLAVGCGDDDTGTPPVEGPVNLSGTYTLRSFSSILTMGATLTTPAVSGTLTLQQTASTDDEATGTFLFEVMVPDGQGNTNPVNDAGTYTVRADGTWEQRGTILPQGTGNFTLVSGTLTINVTAPTVAASTSVWQRQ